MYSVVTRVRVASGRAEEFIDRIHGEIQEFIGRWPGFKSSRLYRYQGDTYRFMHIVVWEDRENSYALARDPAYKAKRAELHDGLVTQFELECYDEVADDGPVPG
jgi:heme-degrading monooxygenase HmoA